MKRIAVFVVILVSVAIAGHAQTTLAECLQLATENYPLIKKYDLIAATEAINLEDINKGWLPRVGVYAQGTVQNVVPEFPAMLENVMHQMGGNVKGLGKWQYKAGVDVNQSIWDGGASKTRRSVQRSQSKVERAAIEVEVYEIRQRVESVYFAVLLIESQQQQINSALEVYRANLERLQSMLRNGTAMQSDVDMMEAQILGLRQQLTQSEAAEKGYRQMLGIFTGKDMMGTNLEIPEASLPSDMTINRPEMRAFDLRESLNSSQTAMINASTMPRVGFFAQAYYGYPGIDYFKAMMQRTPTFNILAGVKVSWALDSFYTKRNALKKIAISNSEINADRATFEFNNRMQTAAQINDLEGIKKVMADDSEIVRLRGNVRRAAESQLRNGIIDVSVLTTKINDETQARLMMEYHKIQYVQQIYKLKNTLNR